MQKVGTLALGIGGGVIGSFFGAPGVGATAGLFIGSLLFGQDTTVRGPIPPATRFTNIGQGNNISVVYGTALVSGQIIWAGPDRIEKIKHKESAKGSSLGGSATTVEYRKRVSVAYGICEGEVNLIQVWANNKKIFDAENPVQNSNLMGDYEFFSGSQTQLPSGTIEAEEGTGNVPGYRGLAYIVFNDWDLSYWGNQPPALQFVVTTSSSDANTFETHTPSSIAGASIGSVLSGFPVDTDGNGMLIDLTENSNEKVIRWNFITNTREEDYPVNVAAGMTFDARYFYSTGGVGNTSPVYRYDRYTGQTLASSAAVGNGGQLHMFRDTFEVAGTELEGVGICYHTGFHPSLSSGRKVYAFEPHTMDTYWSIPHSDLGSGSASNPAGSSLDRKNGDIYIAHGGTPRHYIKITREAYVSWDIDLETSDGITSGRIKYIEETDSLLIFQSGTVYEINAEDGTINRSAILSDAPATGQTKNFQNPPVNGLFYYAANPGIVELNIYTLESRTIERADVGGASIDSTATYNPYRKSVYTSHLSTTNIQEWKFDRITDGTTTLDVIIKDQCERAGLVDGVDFDVTNIADISIRGYVVNAQSKGAQAIDPLLSAFFVNLNDVDGMLKFEKWTDTAIVTISEEDLRASSPGKMVDELVRTRIQDIELPDQITVDYVDVNEAYDSGSQIAQRRVGNSQNHPVVNLSGLVLSSTEARSIAERLLYSIWEASRTFEFSIPLKYIYLNPGDIINITTGNNTNKMILGEINQDKNILKCNAFAVGSGTFDLTDVENDIGSQDDTSHDLDLILPSKLAWIDSVLLTNADNSPGFYAALYHLGDTESYDGGILYQILDEYIPTKVFDSLNAAQVGRLNTDLAAYGSNTFDEANTINVQWFDPDYQPSDSTDSDILNGANALLIESANGWEVCQFVNADDTSGSAGNASEMTRLLRGRRGSEQFEEHLAGHRVIAIETLNHGITNVVEDISNLNVERVFAPVTFNLSIEEATKEVQTNAFIRLYPRAPAQFTGIRQMNNDIIYTWVRRDRLGDRWLNYNDAPLSEDTESYEVAILDGGGSEVRTISSSTETATYTEAEQITDGITGTTDAICYQISAEVDRGFGSTTTTD